MENEIVSKIGNIIQDNIPSVTFELAVFRVKMLKGYSESSSFYILNNHRVSSSSRTVNENGKKEYAVTYAETLRNDMYNLSPMKGAWYSMEMIVFPNGNLNIHFEYEIKPEFSIPLSDLDFIKDFQMFPREKAYIPEWLSEILERNQVI